MPPRERFDKELSGLTADLMDMASMVNGVIRKTSEALEENDMKQAHRIGTYVNAHMTHDANEG